MLGFWTRAGLFLATHHQSHTGHSNDLANRHKLQISTPEKDKFSWYLPETASNLLRVTETLAGAAAVAITEQNRAKPSGTEQNRAFPVLPRAKNRAKPSCAVKNGGLTGATAASILAQPQKIIG
jgi:hypothetical protein